MSRKNKAKICKTLVKLKTLVHFNRFHGKQRLHYLRRSQYQYHKEMTHLALQKKKMERFYGAGLYLNFIFRPLKIALMEISRSRFKQSRNSWLIQRIYVMGVFWTFFVNFWVCLGENSFFKGLVKSREIRNIEDLTLGRTGGGGGCMPPNPS